MKHLLLCFILMHTVEASTLTLQSILDASNHDNAMMQAIEQENLALNARTKADTSNSALELFTEGTKAYPDQGNSGVEYLVGFSKTMRLGNVQEQEENMGMLNNQAYILDEERNVLNFQNGLKNLYHQHCLDKQNYRNFHNSYKELVKLYTKKEKAYKYHEISKTELMQLEIEKNRLYAQVQEMKMQQEMSKVRLLTLSKLHPSGSTLFSCRDMYPIRSAVKLSDTFTLTNEAYTKRVQSTQEALKRHSHALDSINLSVQYGKELDMDKYTVGVSVPLTFSSSKSEYERAAALYKGSALSYRYEQQMLEKRSQLSQLTARLKSNALMVKTLSANYLKYKQKLLPLIRKSYDLGETSVIEYLLNRQKSYQLSQEVYATKKAYYNTLFSLYTLSEQKEN